MTTPTTDECPPGTCCGTGGAWTPKPGEPLITSCMLCPQSGERHWRNSDGVRARAERAAAE